MKKLVLGIALFLTTLVSSGCFGPYYVPDDLDYTLLNVEKPITGVVVSNFFTGQYASSTTQSGNIITTRESLNVDEVSFEIARILQKAGIPTRAISKAQRKDLKPGELLISGVLQNKKGFRARDTGDYVNWALCIGTLALYGCFTPYFYPMSMGELFEIKVQVEDRKGNILLSSNEKLDAYYKVLFIWCQSHCFGAQTPYMKDVSKIVGRGLVEALKPHMKR